MAEFLVRSYLATCDGKSVSGFMRAEYIATASNDIRAQQERAITEHQRPANAPVDLGPWTAASEPHIRRLRADVLRLCKGARQAPRQLIVPVSAAGDSVYSALPATAKRTGSVVEIWTEVSPFTSEPHIYNSVPLRRPDGTPLMRTVFSGEKRLAKEMFNCATREHGVTAVVTYDASGKIESRASQSKEESGFEELVPGSVGESMLDFVCRLY
jgi:hypothetical protein